MLVWLITSCEYFRWILIHVLCSREKERVLGLNVKFQNVGVLFKWNLVFFRVCYPWKVQSNAVSFGLSLWLGCLCFRMSAAWPRGSLSERNNSPTSILSLISILLVHCLCSAADQVHEIFFTLLLNLAKLIILKSYYLLKFSFKQCGS
jgi:hypothetical protein